MDCQWYVGEYVAAGGPESTQEWLDGVTGPRQWVLLDIINIADLLAGWATGKTAGCGGWDGCGWAHPRRPHRFHPLHPRRIAASRHCVKTPYDRKGTVHTVYTLQ